MSPVKHFANVVALEASVFHMKLACSEYWNRIGFQTMCDVTSGANKSASSSHVFSKIKKNNNTYLTGKKRSSAFSWKEVCVEVGGCVYVCIVFVCACVSACMACRWLGVSSCPIIDSFRQANRLLGPQVPEMVMGTLFNWGNRRAFRDLLIKRNPSHTAPPHTHTHWPQHRQTDRQSDSSASRHPSSLTTSLHQDPESAGVDSVYDQECLSVCVTMTWR